MPNVFLLTGGVYVVMQAVAIAGMITKPRPKVPTAGDDMGVELQVCSLVVYIDVGDYSKCDELVSGIAVL